MAVTFAVILLVAGCLIVASLIVTVSQESGFAISVTVELLSQIAYILALMTFSTSGTRTQDEKKGGQVSSHAARQTTTHTASLTMEIDD